MRKIAALAATAGLVFTAATAQADEGMWTFDGFPAARMKATYGWAPDQAWLDRVQASAVRLTGGCSASFVSAEGLILTNHHCVAQCAQDLSSNSKDYLKAGFIAGDRAREQKCPGQQAEVVTEITDVTKPVTAAIAALSGEALTKARDAQIAQIEAQNCTDKATTRCQVVTLYGGGQYKLYKYRKYSDVRLVWAPEFAAAFFGGDPDNFNFPRYDLDASFLRAYENGRPVSTPAHLRWNPRGPIANEATFVVGNPGRTQRLLTQDQLAFQREVAIPLTTFVVMPAEALALAFDAAGLGAPFWWIAGHGLALLLWLARGVAAAPGAVAALPAMPAGAFALMVGGGLWLALWRSGWRCWGLIPIVAGALWTVTTPAPDLIVTGDGRHLAVRDGQGHVAILRDRAGDYVRDLLAESGGLDGEPMLLSDSPAARCNADLCLIERVAAGRRWRILATRSAYLVPAGALIEWCRQVDMVVSERRLPKRCTPRWLRLDRPALARTGGVAVTFATGRVATVRQCGDRHPWRVAAGGGC